MPWIQTIVASASDRFAKLGIHVPVHSEKNSGPSRGRGCGRSRRPTPVVAESGEHVYELLAAGHRPGQDPSSGYEYSRLYSTTTVAASETLVVTTGAGGEFIEAPRAFIINKDAHGMIHIFSGREKFLIHTAKLECDFGW